MTLYINFLAWMLRIISLACFANNAIHPWPQMQTPRKLLSFHLPGEWFWPDFANFKHFYTQEFNRSYSFFLSANVRGKISQCLQMMLMFDQEMPLGFTHAICLCCNFVYISTLENRGDTSLNLNFQNILLNSLLTFGKSCWRPRLHGLINQS